MGRRRPWLLGAQIGLLVMMLLILVLPSVLRERPGERLFPWTSGAASPETLRLKPEIWSEILYILRSAFLLRNSMIVALCILLVGTAIGLKDALWPVFTIQRLGWDNSAYTDMVAGANVLGAVATMLLAGWLADRVGKVRIITVYLALMALGWLLLANSEHLWQDPSVFTGFVFAIQFVETFCTVATLATAMNLCWTRVAATQFTIYMVCNNLGISLAAAMLGPLREWFDWSGLFAAMSAMVLGNLVLWQFMRLRKHQVALEGLEEALGRKAHMAHGPVSGVVPELGVAWQLG